MKQTVKFSQIAIGQKFTACYNGEELIKYKSDRARPAGFYGCGTHFSGIESCEIEVNNPESVSYEKPIDAPATDSQLRYLAILGVRVDGQITKKYASALIDAAKSGDGVGYLSATFTDESM